MTDAIITYSKNPLYTDRDAAAQPRLYAHLDLSAFGIEKPVEKLAIYYRALTRPVGPVRVVYSTSIAGLPVEAGNLQRLKQGINDLTRTLIRFERLPEYLFQLGDKAWPIYRTKNQLLTRYPGGPVFSSEDIASLRVWLADHFKSLGRIRFRREMGLLYLSPYNLKLYTPYCVLRTLDEAVADIPIFPSLVKSGLKLIAPLGSTSITTTFNHGLGIFTIREAVTHSLLETQQLQNADEITIRKMSAEAWQALQTVLTPYPERLTFTREINGREQRDVLPVYTIGSSFVAGRINRIGRVVLYMATGMTGLRQRVGADLHYHGSIDDPDEVEIVTGSLVQAAVGKTGSVAHPAGI